MSATELGIDFALVPPCRKCGHAHAHLVHDRHGAVLIGEPCRAPVKELECLCWVYEPTTEDAA